jgi:hypothetical protein
MLLLACLGPDLCQRHYRLLGCRQFPFFPYITTTFEFIGLAYEWEFEDSCWVINHLEKVTQDFIQQFILTYDALFAMWGDEFTSYINRSEDLRRAYKKKKRRFPLVSRSGRLVCVDPRSEVQQPVSPRDLPKYGPYRNEHIGG